MSGDPAIPVEWMQASIRVPDLDSPRSEAEIAASLDGLNGVRSFTLHEGEVHVVYDPLRVSEQELTVAIQRSGHSADAGTTERDTPLAPE